MMMDVRVQKTNVFTNTATIAYRNLLKTIHNPEQFMDVIIQPVMFMLMFGYLFGGAIAGDVKGYLPTIVPGVLIQTLLSAAAGSGTQIRDDLDSGVFDRFKSLPIAHIAPLAGQLFADILRLLIATAVSLLTGFIMGWRPTVGFGWVLAAALLAIFLGWALSWVFALFGLLAKSSTMVQSFSMITMMVLSFMSSAFVPVKTMPKIMQNIVNINPVTYVIKATRTMLEHGEWSQQAWIVLGAGVLIVAVFARLTVLAYNKKN